MQKKSRAGRALALSRAGTIYLALFLILNYVHRTRNDKNFANLQALLQKNNK